MEQTLTPGELAEIERRAAEATPGPWEAGVRYERFGVNPGLRPGEGPYSFLLVGRCFVCAESGEAPVCTERDRFGTTYHVHRVETDLSRPGIGWRAISSAGTREVVVESYEGMLSAGLRSPDAAFIAHAREDVPRLVAEVRRLGEILATLEELRQQVEDVQRAAEGVLQENRRLRVERSERFAELRQARAGLRRAVDALPEVGHPVGVAGGEEG